jgi:hypothetical protein
VTLSGSIAKNKVTLGWTAATDNVGVVGYRVYRNGTLAATTTSRTWSEPVKKGTTNYTVKAYDAAGNEALVSNTYTTKK